MSDSIKKSGAKHKTPVLTVWTYTFVYFSILITDLVFC